MSNPLDTDAGSELFSSYEAEMKLIMADLNQKIDTVAESAGEARKTAVRQAENALEEARDLLDQLRIEKQNVTIASACYGWRDNNGFNRFQVPRDQERTKSCETSRFVQDYCKNTSYMWLRTDIPP